MEIREYRTIDKSAWGEGPWTNEPDKRQWTDAETGLPCLIVRGPSGSLCGYVGVSPGHVLHGVGYGEPAPVPKECAERIMREMDVLDLYAEELREGTVCAEAILAVHGGLTFARGCSHGDDEARGICHIPSSGEPDDVWWFGFDCAHAGDFTPGSNWQLPERLRETLGAPTGWGGVMTYRDQAYVEGECRDLARRLAALAG